jgi:hypothetical protein
MECKWKPYIGRSRWFAQKFKGLLVCKLVWTLDSTLDRWYQCLITPLIYGAQMWACDLNSAAHSVWQTRKEATQYIFNINTVRV